MIIIADRPGPELEKKMVESVRRQNRGYSRASIQDIERVTRVILDNLSKQRLKKPGQKGQLAKQTQTTTQPPARPMPVDPDRVPEGNLLELVAMQLCGRRATVDFGLVPKSGLIEYMADGSCRIVINETLTGWQPRFKVFLHECAHARYDGPRTRGTDEEEKFREDRAKAKADMWADYAERNWHRFGSNSEHVMFRSLRALLNCES